MRVFTIMCIIACFVFVGCEGPVGPQGEKGESGKDGESLEIIDIKGILFAGDMINDGDYEYWDIELPEFSKTFFISIVVSAGSEYAWWNPISWGYALYDNKSFARIYREGNWVNSGYQYMISIAY